MCSTNCCAALILGIRSSDRVPVRSNSSDMRFAGRPWRGTTFFTVILVLSR